MFIIGAGAHVPYGYPTAQRLTDLLKSLKRDCRIVTAIGDTYLQSGNQSELQKHKIRICRHLMQLNLIDEPDNSSTSNAYTLKVGKELESFLTGFGQAQVYSIDAYLANYMKLPEESRNDLFPKIGKVLISYFIKDYEEKTPIGFHKFDWIQYIINEHLLDKGSLNEFFKKPPKIYTFNYDNHFEKSLYCHLKSYHGFSSEEAKKMINLLEIRHVYGHIDSLNQASIDDIVKRSLDALLVMGEERNKYELLKLSKEISQTMHESEHVYFLGFGFDRINTALLFQYFDPKAQNRNPEFYATNVGLTKYDFTLIYDRVPVSLTIQYSDDEVVDSSKLISAKIPIFPDTKSKNITDYFEETFDDDSL